MEERAAAHGAARRLGRVTLRPAPLATLLRSGVDRYRGEDPAASLAELEDAIRRDRRQVQRGC